MSKLAKSKAKLPLAKDDNQRRGSRLNYAFGAASTSTSGAKTFDRMTEPLEPLSAQIRPLFEQAVADSPSLTAAECDEIAANLTMRFHYPNCYVVWMDLVKKVRGDWRLERQIVVSNHNLAVIQQPLREAVKQHSGKVRFDYVEPIFEE